MKKSLLSRIGIFSVLSAALISCHPVDDAKYYEEGVSKFLAVYRSATIKDVKYKLSFSIPETKTDPVTGEECIELTISSNSEPLLIDFRAPAGNLRSVKVNGQITEADISHGHIIIPSAKLQKHYNRIDIVFIAGDMSLNRNDEFLYTLFVPDRASTAFPCFDQPDIKGIFTLDLDIPDKWESMSNSPVRSIDLGNGRKTIHYAETRPLSTYLFAFVAGRFSRIEKEIDGIKMEMLHRETRPSYIAENADEIFNLHYNSLKWLENYTGIPYPFDKAGFVLIPSFQYNGMEHPGSVLYRASSLLLEPSPTLNEELKRATLIAHETSHMWFGDLVTMKWFDDVWLKEVFAGYFADQIVNPDFPAINHDLRFYLSHFPAAYKVDRTQGSNPVIQQLNNMKDAGSLYGGIIYNKAPVIMRMLEQTTGTDQLRAGLQNYLSGYSYGNADWDDLIEILEKASSADLEDWSEAWAREAGMPLIAALEEQNDDVFNVRLGEEDPAVKNRSWPQQTITMVVTANDTMTAALTPGDNDSFISSPEKPVCILPDISGYAYGSFILDSTTLSWLELNINTIKDPLLRGITWVNLNENHINKKISSSSFYRMITASLVTEEEELLRDYLCGLLPDIFWNYLSQQEKEIFIHETEDIIRTKLREAGKPSAQRTWFNLLMKTAYSHEGLDLLYSIWQKGELPGSLRLNENEQCSLALTLALYGHPESNRILTLQHDRITNADRKQEFEFVMPSVSKDDSVRDAFFASLADASNREHEPWVIESLGYLHHQLMAEESEKYILPSLEMLEEIKSTGDIFFPASWISTTLAGHHSLKARETVLAFLQAHPGYPYDLRLKILQASDHLLRMEEEKMSMAE